MEALNFRNDIRMLNILNEAKYNLSNMALDILYIFIANIKIDDKEFKQYEIRISELEKRIGRKLNRDSLKKAATELSDTVIDFNNEDINNIKWFEKFELNSSLGTIEAKINNELHVYLLDLPNKFTLGYLDSLLSLKSGYAKRIYLLMCQYSGMAKRKISVEDLNNILNTPESFKHSVGNFKLKILDPAIADIKKYSDLKIFVQEIKYGRAITHFVFKVNGSKKKTNSLNSNSSVKKKNIESNKAGVSAAEKWLQEHNKNDSIELNS